MRDRYLGGVVVLFSTLFGSISWGQSALDQLEQKLEGAQAPAVPAGVPAPPKASEDTLPAPPDSPPQTNKNAAEPGYLGIVVEEAREGEAGPRVSTVREGSPAAAVGARVGDLVQSIDGRAIRTLDDMDAVLSQGTAGQTLRMVLSRNGEQLTLSPVLMPRVRRTPVVPAVPAVPDFKLGASQPQTTTPPAAAVSGKASLGVHVANITPESRQRFNLPVPRGALITSLSVGSAAEQAGMPLGGAIVAMDGRVVETADQLVGMIREAKPGQEVELTYYQGDQLFRKSVRLAAVPDTVGVPNINGQVVENPVPAEPTPAAPAVGGGLFQGGGDRPLLRTLEKVIQGVGNVEINGQPLPSTVLRPAAPQAIPAPVPGNGISAPVSQEVVELRAQVRLLQEQMERMERLLKKYEEQAVPKP